MKIWRRYLFKEQIKLILLFFVAFLSLYTVIDYASHVEYFRGVSGDTNWGWVCVYYLCDLSRRLSILLPFAIVLATIRTLTTMNQHGELIALLISGITKRAILTPLLFVGIAASALVYVNSEFFLPKALHTLQLFQEKRVNQRNKGKPHVRHLILQDESSLLFQDYKYSTETFEDIYWIRSIDEVWRMDRLSMGTPHPIAYELEKVIRSSDGKMEIQDKIASTDTPEIVFNKKRLFETITAPEERSLSDLWQHLPRLDVDEEKQAGLLSVFLYKLLLPTLCLFTVVLPAPSVMRFSRQPHLFLIYSLSLFLLVAFILLINAMLILGKQQVLSPIFAIGTPFFILFVFFLWNFKRLR
ncbi:MAG: LptF/LptG family permease [Waddliaceae bacterium]